MSYDTDARSDVARELRPIASGGVGQTVTLKSTVNGAFDAATLTQAVTSTSQTGSGIERAYRASQIDGTLIRAGDKRFLLSGLNSAGAVLSPEPQPGFLLTVGGRDWTIITVEPLAPAGTAIMYGLQLRGAAA